MGFMWACYGRQGTVQNYSQKGKTKYSTTRQGTAVIVIAVSANTNCHNCCYYYGYCFKYCC